MNWNSPAEFFAMGGYAFYVWSSVLACVLYVVLEIVLLRQRRRAVVQRLRRERLAASLDQQGGAA